MVGEHLVAVKPGGEAAAGGDGQARHADPPGQFFLCDGVCFRIAGVFLILGKPVVSQLGQVLCRKLPHGFVPGFTVGQQLLGGTAGAGPGGLAFSIDLQRKEHILSAPLDFALEGIIVLVQLQLTQHLIPATDLDEQISQAGKEASGTGNMKFALNGAMTVGTLDGANVEIRERVGAENFFLFGMTVDEVEKKYAEGYNPASYYEADPRLKHAIDMVADGTFSNGDRNAYSPLVADWLTKDWFMTLADFSAYMDIQSEIEALYADELEWNRKALLNVANSGYFSSDRSMEDYLERIWHTAPLAD